MSIVRLESSNPGQAITKVMKLPACVIGTPASFEDPRSAAWEMARVSSELRAQFDTTVKPATFRAPREEKSHG